MDLKLENITRLNANRIRVEARLGADRDLAIQEACVLALAEKKEVELVDFNGFNYLVQVRGIGLNLSLCIKEYRA
jgi:hypothetical protein